MNVYYGRCLSYILMYHETSLPYHVVEGIIITKNRLASCLLSTQRRRQSLLERCFTLIVTESITITNHICATITVRSASAYSVIGITCEPGRTLSIIPTIRRSRCPKADVRSTQPFATSAVTIITWCKTTHHICIGCGASGKFRSCSEWCFAQGDAIIAPTDLVFWAIFVFLATAIIVIIVFDTCGLAVVTSEALTRLSVSKATLRSFSLSSTESFFQITSRHGI